MFFSLQNHSTYSLKLFFCRLVKTADKMLKEAEHSDVLHDEERAYVLFMKYFNVVQFIKKSQEYKKDKVSLNFNT